MDKKTSNEMSIFSTASQISHPREISQQLVDLGFKPGLNRVYHKIDFYKRTDWAGITFNTHLKKFVIWTSAPFGMKRYTSDEIEKFANVELLMIFIEAHKNDFLSGNPVDGWTIG